MLTWYDGLAARDSTSREVLHSKTLMQGGTPSLGGKDLAAALPRKTVAAIQKRRAAAEAQGRGWWKDRVWFFWLVSSFVWSVGTFLYAISTGKLADLGAGSSADWVGQGLQQVVEHKTRVFLHVPFLAFVLAVIWLQVTWRFPRFSIYASILAAPVCLLGCTSCLLVHAVQHSSPLLAALATMLLVLTLAVSLHMARSIDNHCVLLTSCLLVEGATWLRHRCSLGWVFAPLQFLCVSPAVCQIRLACVVFEMFAE